ncbi:Mur ligase family protein [Candidatus Haliotispira prima]|uniref:UDP-N-acetylmuramyl-tripeptide synthetase n=1 Tax=Candidatus Haliotispira prima TaxID=3034016 RepID=A0ABY8MLC8_9SPIO|nr:Mur ligase family protein [Candidatus Haliotispira prima]
MVTDGSPRQLFDDEPILLAETSLCELEALLDKEQMLRYSSLSETMTGNTNPEKADVYIRRQKFAPCCDSRLLKPYHIFVALAGETFDGHKFIAEALDAGIQALVYQNEPEPELKARIRRAEAQENFAAFQVNDSRQTLSLLSAHCFGYPSRKIEVLGITGTDGKTSIAYLCYQILQSCHRKQGSGAAGLISTFGLDLGWGLRPNPMHQTTPESNIVQRALAGMLAGGCRFAVLECSSHGLSPKTARLQHVEFSAALFSNLSPEHLEFHGDMECYARDKARLFRSLKSGGTAVWNAAEPAAEMLYAASGARHDVVHQAYAPDANGDAPPPNGRLPRLPAQNIPYTHMFRVQDLSLGLNASHFTIVSSQPGHPSGPVSRYRCTIPIPTSIYVSNTIAALSLCHSLLHRSSGAETVKGCETQGCEAAKRETERCEAKASETLGDLTSILQSLQQTEEQSDTDTASEAEQGKTYHLALRAPKGRMELIRPLGGPANFTVLVDYAHSPGSFARLLPEIRDLLDRSAGKGPTGRLLILFGSGGQRDRQKRPLQGRLAARYADIIVLCNEDPREEDEMQILRDIQSGIPTAEKNENPKPEEPGNSTEKRPVTGQNVFLIPDRRQAMARIFALAENGDLVLLLGKGHETSIILANRREIPWDERETALELLQEPEGKNPLSRFS